MKGTPLTREEAIERLEESAAESALWVWSGSPCLVRSCATRHAPTAMSIFLSNSFQAQRRLTTFWLFASCLNHGSDAAWNW